MKKKSNSKLKTNCLLIGCVLILILLCYLSISRGLNQGESKQDTLPCCSIPPSQPTATVNR